jgi:SH3-like domain-containing protein
MKEIIRENMLLCYVYLAIIVLFVYSRFVVSKKDKVIVHWEKSQNVNANNPDKVPWWNVKKTMLYRIEEVKHNWENDTVLYSEYWLFTKDSQWNKYMSERFRDLEYHPWRKLEDMKVSYGWVTYDLSRTEQSMKQINWNIARIETELLANPEYWKRVLLEKELSKMKEFLSMINEWPSSSYVVIKGKKYTIWDIVKVYIDPFNEKNYYLDI